jgi:hypothetical protein
MNVTAECRNRACSQPAYWLQRGERPHEVPVVRRDHGHRQHHGDVQGQAETVPRIPQ